MSIRVSRIAYPITTLGPGRYLGLWVQGCDIKCSGCVSKDTWDKTGGRLVDERSLADSIIEIIGAAKDIEGIVVTGGEPTEQADSLCKILAWISEALPQVDVILFSGVSREALSESYGVLISCVDLAICGPYISGLPSSRPMIASDNQCYMVCSNRGHALLSKLLKMEGACSIQCLVDEQSITMAGLPFPSGMELLEDELRERGIVFSEASWRI